MKPRIYRHRRLRWWVTEVRGHPVGYSGSWTEALARLVHQHDVDTWWAAQDPLAPRPAGTPAPMPSMPRVRTWRAMDTPSTRVNSGPFTRVDGP